MEKQVRKRSETETEILKRRAGMFLGMSILEGKEGHEIVVLHGSQHSCPSVRQVMIVQAIIVNFPALFLTELNHFEKEN